MELILQAIKSLFRKLELNRTHWEETKEVVLVDNYTSSEYSEGTNIPACNFVVGQKYKVIWNGETYENVVCYTDSDDDCNCLGGDDYPFYIDDDGGGSLFVEPILDVIESTDFTVSISTVETIVHKLDEKYIPDSVYNKIKVAQTTANSAQTTADSKMDRNNPAGTGSFSLNRKSGSTVGTNSFVCGSSNTASGHDSHAEGYETTAFGSSSHAEGRSTTASGNSQHVQGKFNIDDTTGTYSHIVGNGTNYSSRSNAHTLDWSGNAWYAGDVYVGSTSGKNKDEGSKKLATEEYVDSKQSDTSLGLTGAAVGQIGRITAVDSDGKPTAWEPVDMPSGGGSSEDTWELIDQVDCTSGDVVSIAPTLSKAYKAIMITNSPLDVSWFDTTVGSAIFSGSSPIEITTNNRIFPGVFNTNGSIARRQHFIIRYTERTKWGSMWEYFGEIGTIRSGGVCVGTSQKAYAHALTDSKITELKIKPVASGIFFANTISIYGIPD